MKVIPRKQRGVVSLLFALLLPVLLAFGTFLIVASAGLKLKTSPLWRSLMRVRPGFAPHFLPSFATKRTRT